MENRYVLFFQFSSISFASLKQVFKMGSFVNFLLFSAFNFLID